MPRDVSISRTTSNAFFSNLCPRRRLLRVKTEDENSCPKNIACVKTCHCLPRKLPHFLEYFDNTLVNSKKIISETKNTIVKMVKLTRNAMTTSERQ